MAHQDYLKLIETMTMKNTAMDHHTIIGGTNLDRKEVLPRHQKKAYLTKSRLMMMLNGDF